MSVRVRYKISAFVSSTTAEDKDLGNQQWEVMTDTQGEGGAWKSTLQPGDIDVKLNLGNLTTAQLVIIRTQPRDPTMPANAITLRRNTTLGEAFVVQALGDAKEGHFVLSTDMLTALYATNPVGGTAMDIVVVATGD